MKIKIGLNIIVRSNMNKTDQNQDPKWITLIFRPRPVRNKKLGPMKVKPTNWLVKVENKSCYPTLWIASYNLDRSECWRLILASLTA